MLFRLAVLVLFGLMGAANAACDWAEQAERSGKAGIAIMQYMYCAEEENDAEAQYKLGTLFYLGKGLKKPDFRRSVVYYALSARNGYAPAQTKLGLLYWRGEGIEQSFVDAHKWLYLAQEQPETRWFYYYGVSADKTAGQLYDRLNKTVAGLAARKTVQTGENFGPDLVAGAVSVAELGVPFSYNEVVAFQHENLRLAGEDFLSSREMAMLEEYMNNMNPMDKPANIEKMRKMEPAQAKEFFKQNFKSTLLTPENFDTKKVPILGTLKERADNY